MSKAVFLGHHSQDREEEMPADAGIQLLEAILAARMKSSAAEGGNMTGTPGTGKSAQ